jgi:dTDP-L-rhamnose 4-epimerase
MGGAAEARKPLFMGVVSSFMGRKILNTGGAGFVGSHLADELIEHGYDLRVLDSLSPQVYGPDARPPDYLNPEVEFLKGDRRRPKARACRELTL